MDPMTRRKQVRFDSPLISDERIWTPESSLSTTPPSPPSGSSVQLPSMEASSTFVPTPFTIVAVYTRRFLLSVTPSLDNRSAGRRLNMSRSFDSICTLLQSPVKRLTRGEKVCQRPYYDEVPRLTIGRRRIFTRANSSSNVDHDEKESNKDNIYYEESVKEKVRQCLDEDANFKKVNVLVLEDKDKKKQQGKCEKIAQKKAGASITNDEFLRIGRPNSFDVLAREEDEEREKQISRKDYMMVEKWKDDMEKGNDEKDKKEEEQQQVGGATASPLRFFLKTAALRVRLSDVNEGDAAAAHHEALRLYDWQQGEKKKARLVKRNNSSSPKFSNFRLFDKPNAKRQQQQHVRLQPYRQLPEEKQEQQKEREERQEQREYLSEQQLDKQQQTSQRHLKRRSRQQTQQKSIFANFALSTADKQKTVVKNNKSIKIKHEGSAERFGWSTNSKKKLENLTCEQQASQQYDLAEPSDANQSSHTQHTAPTTTDATKIMHTKVIQAFPKYSVFTRFPNSHTFPMSTHDMDKFNDDFVPHSYVEATTSAGDVGNMETKIRRISLKEFSGLNDSQFEESSPIRLPTGIVCSPLANRRQGAAISLLEKFSNRRRSSTGLNRLSAWSRDHTAIASSIDAFSSNTRRSSETPKSVAVAAAAMGGSGDVFFHDSFDKAIESINLAIDEAIREDVSNRRGSTPIGDFYATKSLSRPEYDSDYRPIAADGTQQTKLDFNNIFRRLSELRARIADALRAVPNKSPNKTLNIQREKLTILNESRHLVTACKIMVRSASPSSAINEIDLASLVHKVVESAERVGISAEAVIRKSTSLFHTQLFIAKLDQVLSTLTDTIENLQQMLLPMYVSAVSLPPTPAAATTADCGDIAKRLIRTNTKLAANLTQLIQTVHRF